MKLFSNFDTKIKSKSIEEATQEYGEENVLCLSRSKLFFVIKFFLPLLEFLILVFAGILLFYYLFDYLYLVQIIVVMLLVSLPFIVYITGKYIDYKMDFVLVTPDALMEYNQSWVFNKKVVTINEKSIKSITVERKGFLYSIFNNGDLVFFSEGDETRGDVTLYYVSDPELKKTQISKIMNKD